MAGDTNEMAGNADIKLEDVPIIFVGTLMGGWGSNAGTFMFTVNQVLKGDELRNKLDSMGTNALRVDVLYGAENSTNGVIDPASFIKGNHGRNVLVFADADLDAVCAVVKGPTLAFGAHGNLNAFKIATEELVADVKKRLATLAQTNSPPANKPQPDLVSVTLDEVSVYAAIRMGKRISNGLYFTNDSIPKEELEKIIVSVNVKDVTMQEYLRQVASSAGLKIEIVRDDLLRVTRTQK
jgi:hypothetical protein